MSTAADLLLALNSQVKHPSSNGQQSHNKQSQSPHPQTLQAIPEQANIYLSKHQHLIHDSKSEESHEPPECLVQLLTKQVGTDIPEGLSEVVQQILKQRQKNTYESLTSDNDYRIIELMLQGARKKNESNIDLIAQAMTKRTGRVERELEEGTVLIIPEVSISSKKELQFASQLDLARMIKIKEGELRSKMDLLHEKISNLEEVQSWNGLDQEQERVGQQLQARLAESMNYNNYALDSEKTKIASQYVRHMHRQRRLFERRKKQREERYKDHEAQRQAELQEAHQMKDLAKRQQIIERIEQRRKKRQEEQERLESKEKEVLSFLAEFHSKNPLFKEKEKQFYERIVKVEERLRQEKLNEIRENRNSLSINEIKHHEQRYLNSLKTGKAKREQQFKLILKSRRSEDLAKVYYKGSAHKRMNDMLQASQKRKQSLLQASKLKAVRRREYSEVIHTKHKPQVDERKKQQLMSYIEADLLRKNKAKKVYKQVIDQQTNEPKMIWHYEPLPERDYRSEGKKFFLEAKRLAKRKQSAHSQHASEEDKPKKGQLLNSLHLLKEEGGSSKTKDIWSARTKQLKAFAGLQVVDAKNFEFVKHNIQNLDNKALQREDLLKKLNLSVEEHIESKGMLDQFYIQSIKEKIKLLEKE